MLLLKWFILKKKVDLIPYYLKMALIKFTEMTMKENLSLHGMME